MAWGVCPSGYTFTGTGCYRFAGTAGSGTIDWFVSEAQCEADGPGRHLVVLDTMAEAMAVDTFVPSTIVDHFVGATDLVTEGTYISVLGTPFPYINWDTGQPAGGTARNCMIFTDATTMQAEDCVNGDDYVCEYDGIAPVPAAWGQ